MRELTGNSIEIGKVVVGTWLPHHTGVLQTTQEMGLELQIVFNKDAVMVLPAGGGWIALCDVLMCGFAGSAFGLINPKGAVS